MESIRKVTRQDIQTFIESLEAIQRKTIETPFLIEYDTLCFLIENYPKIKRYLNMLFKGKRGDTQYEKVKVEGRCRRCGCVVQQEISLTRFIECIKKEGKGEVASLCNDCEEIINAEKQKEKEEEERKWEEEKARRTEALIQTFLLTPRQANLSNYSLRKLFRHIKEAFFFINKERFIQTAQQMPYSQFLQTLYWQVVSSEKKRKNPFCSLCGKREPLHVHHNNYQIRGREIQNLSSGLIVLCADCHRKFHNVKEVCYG